MLTLYNLYIYNRGIMLVTLYTNHLYTTLYPGRQRDFRVQQMSCVAFKSEWKRNFNQ